MTRDEFRTLRECAPRCDLCQESSAVFAEELRPWEAQEDPDETKASRMVCCDHSGIVEVHGSRRDVWVTVGAAPGDYAEQEFAKWALLGWLQGECADLDVEHAVNAMAVILAGMQRCFPGSRFRLRGRIARRERRGVWVGR